MSQLLHIDAEYKQRIQEDAIYRQPADELVNANRQQPADDFELLFCIPWSHHQRIIDKVQGDSQTIRK